MKKKSQKHLYEPPILKDLSFSTASGQVHPMGNCSSGAYPYTACTVGNIFGDGCNVGSAPDGSLCNVGFYHTKPVCSFGVSAATICDSGQHQQF